MPMMMPMMVKCEADEIDCLSALTLTLINILASDGLQFVAYHLMRTMDFLPRKGFSLG
jgi:hypothetical protein